MTRTASPESTSLAAWWRLPESVWIKTEHLIIGLLNQPWAIHQGNLGSWYPICEVARYWCLNLQFARRRQDHSQRGSLSKEATLKLSQDRFWHDFEYFRRWSAYKISITLVYINIPIIFSAFSGNIQQAPLPLENQEILQYAAEQQPSTKHVLQKDDFLQRCATIPATNLLYVFG